MKTSFHSSFAKDLRSIKDPNLRDRVAELIENVEQATDLSVIPNLKKLRAAGSYFRVRLGELSSWAHGSERHRFLCSLPSSARDLQVFPLSGIAEGYL